MKRTGHISMHQLPPEDSELKSDPCMEQKHFFCKGVFIDCECKCHYIAARELRRTLTAQGRI